MVRHIEVGTIDKLLGELARLKELHGGDTEVVVMQYTGGNEDPFYVTAEEPNDVHPGRVLLEIAGPQL